MTVRRVCNDCDEDVRDDNSCGCPPGSPALEGVSDAPCVPPLWDDVDALMRGFGAITFEEFCGVLKATIGADPDYARGVWGPFRSWPIGYCFSRGPISQGHALFALAVEKGAGLGGLNGTSELQDR